MSDTDDDLTMIGYRENVRKYVADAQKSRVTDSHIDGAVDFIRQTGGDTYGWWPEHKLTAMIAELLANDVPHDWASFTLHDPENPRLITHVDAPSMLDKLWRDHLASEDAPKE